VIHDSSAWLLNISSFLDFIDVGIFCLVTVIVGVRSFG